MGRSPIGGYNYPTSVYATGGSWLVVILTLTVILALAAGILVYALFLAPRNKRPLTGFAKWLHDYLNFNELVTPVIVKIGYVFTAVIVTVMGLVQMCTVVAFVPGLMLLVVGNVASRLVFESINILFSIHDRLKSIDRKMKDQNPAPPAPPRPTAAYRPQAPAAPQAPKAPPVPPEFISQQQPVQQQPENKAPEEKTDWN